jgi:hypothetical protein
MLQDIATIAVVDPSAITDRKTTTPELLLRPTGGRASQ